MFLSFFQNLGSFVLATIIIFDLELHICILIIHTEFFWLVMAGLKENLYTLIHKFVYRIFFTNGTTNYVAAEDFDDIDLILL